MAINEAINNKLPADDYDVVIAGGGAAGFFAAIEAASRGAGKVLILEKSPKFLSKVKISGGGRCNVTHAAFEKEKLLNGYPRGVDFLKTGFVHFAVPETVHWFESRGVRLKQEADGRMFPVTDNSQTIIDCLMRECKKWNIEALTGIEVQNVKKSHNHFELKTNHGILTSKTLIVSTGGAIKASFLNFLSQFQHTIISPVPSLFTFNLPGQRTAEIMGVSMQKAQVSLPGLNLKFTGPVLFTHWGLSGPAVLKLSAFGARELYNLGYKTAVEVNFLPELRPEKLKEKLKEYAAANPKKQVLTGSPFAEIPHRLWVWLMEPLFQNQPRNWAECGKKQWEAMTTQLIACRFAMQGKTTFKDEFVTCGGIDTAEVDPETMMSRKVPGLFFAGEVLNIDGITGGYNFQAAWTTGYLAGKASASYAGY